MSEALSDNQIRQLLKEMLPSPNDYRIVLEIFAAGIQQAASHGDDRWALKMMQGDLLTLRLHVGPVIIQSLVPSGIWLSFDRKTLENLSHSKPLDEYLSQESGEKFEEYPEYPIIDARNFYFHPSGQRWADFELRLWPDLRNVHFPAIDRAAGKNKNGVGARTGRGHRPEVVEFIAAELNIELPAAKNWETATRNEQPLTLEELASKKKSTMKVDLVSNDFKIQLYENPNWVFTVRKDYVERLKSIGLYNEAGKRRVTGPQSDPEKRKELERLISFVESKQIPLAEAFRQKQRLDKPRVLRGSERRKEIVNILNRFDDAYYRALERQGGHG